MKILKLTGNGAARPSTPAARVCLALIGFVAIGPGVANAQICPSPFGTSTDGQLWPWAAWMEYYHVEFEDTLPDSFRASGETHLPLGQLDIQCRTGYAQAAGDGITYTHVCAGNTPAKCELKPELASRCELKPEHQSSSAALATVCEAVPLTGSVTAQGRRCTGVALVSSTAECPSGSCLEACQYVASRELEDQKCADVSLTGSPTAADRRCKNPHTLPTAGCASGACLEACAFTPAVGLTPAAPACTPCGAGNYAAAGDAECKVCEAGKTSPAAQGAHVGAEGAFTSSSCPALHGCASPTGVVVPSGDYCAACPPGKFSTTVYRCELKPEHQASSPASAAECEAVPLTGTATAITRRCTGVALVPATAECPSGSCLEACQYVATGGQICEDCATGKYAAQEGAADCDDCATGKFVGVEGSDEAGDCLDCGAGRYTAFAGSTVGKHAVSTGASICNDCPIGSYNPTVGAAVTCSTNCPYAPDGENSCEVCPVGRYVDVLGSVICIGCRVGQYINVTGSDEISDCIDCYAGKYVDTTGSDEVSDCIDCNAGKYVVITGASSCLECGAHTYAASQASVPGDGSEFHVASGAKICNSCPAGKYGSADGGWAGICDQELAKSLSMWEEHKKLVGFTCVFVLVVLSLSLGLCWASRRHRAKKQLRDKELDDCSYTDPATGETCTEPNAVVAPGAFSKLAPSLKREGSKKQRKREAQEAERAALQKAWDHGYNHRFTSMRGPPPALASAAPVATAVLPTTMAVPVHEGAVVGGTPSADITPNNIMATFGHDEQGTKGADAPSLGRPTTPPRSLPSLPGVGKAVVATQRLSASQRANQAGRPPPPVPYKAP